MPATLAQLTKVRSQLANDQRDYYETVIDRVDRTEWYRHDVMIPARAIAIPARVLKEEVITPPSPRSEYRVRNDESQHEPAWRLIPDEIAALYEEPEGTERRYEVAWPEEQPVVSRAVILGAPGGGKSFLTATTTISIAQQALQQLRDQHTSLAALPFPIHLDLAPLAERCRTMNLADALMALMSDAYAPSPRLLTWMKHTLITNRCWLILDALDQVDEKDRPWLEKLATDTRSWHTHILLTCRRANYNPQWIPWRTRQTYELAPFSPAEVRDFVTTWFGTADSRGAALRHLLDRNFSLSLACRNPLLATLTCLAHEEDAVTTDTRRVDLYELVLRGLIGRVWKSGALVLNDPHIDAMLPLLKSIAWSLFEHKPRSNLFTHDEIIGAIKRTPSLPLPLKVRRGAAHLAAYEDRPQALLEELLDCGIVRIESKTRPQRPGSYSFCHRSFLEYLTAHALADEVSAKGWAHIIEEIDRNAWLPEYQEVIIFLAGLLNDPEPLLLMLANHAPTETNPYGDDYSRHRLALAALCLSEAYPSSRTRELPECAHQITQDIFTLWQRRHRMEDWPSLFGGRYSSHFPHLTAALPALGAVNARIGSTLLLDYVALLLEDEDRAVRGEAVDVVAIIGSVAATQPILNRLACLLQEEPGNYRDIRVWAARAICLIGSVAMTPGIVDALKSYIVLREHSILVSFLRHYGTIPEILALLLNHLNKLLEDDDKEMRKEAVETVAKLGSPAATAPIVARLTQLLKTDDDEYARIVNVMIRIGNAAAMPDIQKRLARLLNDDDAEIRQKAMWHLGRWGGGAALPIVELLAERLTDTDETVRTEAFKTIKRLWSGEATPLIFNHLTSLLEKASSAPELAWAVWNLSDLGSIAATPVILKRLTQLIMHEDEAVQAAAITAIGKLGNAETITPLLNHLAGLLASEPWPERDSYDFTDSVYKINRYKSDALWLREAAATVVGEYGNPTMLAPLLNRLTDLLGNEDFNVCHQVVKVVENLGSIAATAPMLDRLAQLCTKGDSYVKAAPAALVRMGGRAATAPILEQLARLLMANDTYEYWEAQHALGKLGRVPAIINIIEPFMQHLTKDNESLRQAVQWARGVVGPRLSSPSNPFDVSYCTAPEHNDLLEELATLLFRDESKRHAVAAVISQWETQGVRIFHEPDGTWVPRTVQELSKKNHKVL